MLRYVDSSALVKLVAPEPESARLLEHLSRPEDGAVSSALSIVDVGRAVARVRPGDEAAARVEAVLSAVEIRQVDQSILRAASSLEPAGLRTLDAIHLATALELVGELHEFVAYDSRLLEGASRHGLAAVSP